MDTDDVIVHEGNSTVVETSVPDAPSSSRSYNTISCGHTGLSQPNAHV